VSTPFPHLTGAATGLGSMPGTDAREAVKTVLGELEDLPHLPELPSRGVGADMLGRSLGLLVDLYAQVEPSGWRIAERPGRDTRRAHSWLSEDLDALEEFTQGYTGPLKVQATGPWTLAAGVELHNGEKALADPGACRDLAASLAEGLRAHLADLRRRVPGADLVVQLDEPSLPAALAGTVKTASGWQRLRAVDRSIAEESLRRLIDAVDPADSAQPARSADSPDAAGSHDAGNSHSVPDSADAARPLGTPVIVHCCAPNTPVPLLRRAGAAAVSLDWSFLTERDDDDLGEAVEGGTVLLAGVVPSTDRELSDPPGSVSGVRAVWRRLGLDPGLLAQRVVVTPSCGLAGASPAYARRALSHSVKAARSLADSPE
jgi:methionine synthase II (cobalamin-independent)